ncbi:ArnT family glycosyltransferase [Dictyobacter aurantiacus]|uniref:Glycosyltransferase RgtA/B/C/D-like domain-containing protein n=1 Tax=Dictyobacter aurantiacus TaxID=1936993 RepID=A0A401ZC43_9CHLR|nr:hypothetical protein [Dictyobacter aurantiacus]GCE04419.1 hypothetical protein KDAU_17480 [Dictyobacter aurantiacus]
MNTVLSNATSTDEHPSTSITRKGILLIVGALLALLIIGLLMRLYTLGVPFDRDSYDEGVYWQTLRSLAAGSALYHPTFYSQPPMFILSIFPTYLLFGQTLWAARLGIALVSLLGLVGISLLGYALRGWLGAIVALLLLLLAPLYLSASQTIQAEGPQVAFSILAVAFAYLWWHNPSGRRGNVYAGLCTLTLMLSIFSKLFALATLVPVCLLALAHLWRIRQQTAGSRWQASCSLLIGVAVMILATLLIMLPFLGHLGDFWSSVISFHTAASKVTGHISNTGRVVRFFIAPLGIAALYGSIVALVRRDWRVVPLLGWALACAILLWQQEPLFDHHFVIVIPALVALTCMGLGPLPLSSQQWHQLPALLTAGSLLLVLITLGVGARGIQVNYRNWQAQAASGGTQGSLRAAHDLQQAIAPDQLVITDGQFVAALAERNTPPELVDTSSVRINTDYLTSSQLIQLASQPRVHAILFYTGRLTNSKLKPFREWIPTHFREIHSYGKDSSLWVKIQ